jgi:hypothetical protein
MLGVVRRWFAARAEHVTVRFLPEADAAPLVPADGYLRLWLAEGFLADARTWGNDHFPALHGGAVLHFDGSDTAEFTRITRSPGMVHVPGAQLDFPITPLLPYTGGVVEIEASLFRASVAGPLATAVDLAGRLASLVGPPLSTAAAVAGKVGEGMEALLAATGDQPVLGVHWSMVGPGGGGQVLRSGHLVVVNASAAKLPGPLVMVDGLLHVDEGGMPRRLAGFDYLVLRVETRVEHDSWLFPRLATLIREARVAAVNRQMETATAKRAEAITYAYSCPDYTLTDAERVAVWVADRIDSPQVKGIVPPGGPVPQLPRRGSPEVSGVRLSDLLTLRR